MKEKGMNINFWSGAVFAVMAILMLLFGTVLQKAGLSVQKQVKIEDNRRLCEQQSQALSEGSDYLTGEVWSFVATKDSRHMNNYWYEVNERKSREQALEALKKLSLTKEETELLYAAKEASDDLIQGETWAMRLTADSIGMSKEQMPDEISSVRYTKKEAAFTVDEKRESALSYLFGEEYMGAKKVIRSNIDSFRKLLRERKDKEMEQEVSKSVANIRGLHWLMVFLGLAFGGEVVLFYCFILRPLSAYTRALQQMNGNGFSPLNLQGSKELKSCAEAFNQIYVEWSEQKQKLEKERYRFHVALENTLVIVYEYDVATDTYRAFGNLEKVRHTSVGLQTEKMIPDFLKQHVMEVMGEPGLAYFQKVLKSAECEAAELELHPVAGSIQGIWVRITGTPVLDEKQNTTRLIGKITNIQPEKEKEFALEDARSRDGLTGLYKDEPGLHKVREYMDHKSSEEICGMMLVDMDDFGKMNQAEGRVYADAVLHDVADIFRTHTGPEDILVRLGGDEFMLFVKDCPKSRATVLGPEIAACIQELSGGSAFKISASIGMCVTEVVDEFSGLYHCAESTLKYVKEHGKGKAACYLDTSNELGMLLTQMYPEHHIFNKVDRSEGAWEDLSTFALDLLGRSKNLDDAIFLLLSRIGKRCQLDRILIIELNTEYLSCRAVYQWFKDLSDRKSEAPVYVTKEQMHEISAFYDDDGLSEKRVISKASHDMNQILHAGIWNYGQCVGTMCFERKDTHPWSAGERQLLKEMTRIISSFTLKERADAVSRAKTDFLSRMSHEIRTPMNAITGMTLIAKSVPDNPEKTQDCLNKIESSNQYLLQLINDILDMSRIESGKVEICKAAMRIGRLLDNLKILIRPQAEEKGIQFTIENYYVEQRSLMADELRLNQVLVNLLGNAVKFTKEEGNITLKIEPVQTTDTEVVLHFAVKDTGIGISREAQERIFHAFEQSGADTAANYGGTGLGLAISSRLVKLMGGVLEVESELSVGSTFHFTLAFAYAMAEEEDRLLDDRTEESLLSKGKRLLLVEDNELNQEIAREILEMHEFLVETAENGREAVSMFEKNEAGYYDAILMDIRMPVMGGLEATRQIRILGKPDSRSIPIIAMTANAFDEDMKDSIECGMNGHLSKPIDVEELWKTLRRLLIAREHSGKEWE